MPYIIYMTGGERVAADNRKEQQMRLSSAQEKAIKKLVTLYTEKKAHELARWNNADYRPALRGCEVDAQERTMQALCKKGLLVHRSTTISRQHAGRTIWSKTFQSCDTTYFLSEAAIKQYA